MSSETGETDQAITNPVQQPLGSAGAGTSPPTPPIENKQESSDSQTGSTEAKLTPQNNPPGADVQLVPVSQKPVDVGFAPADTTDGRTPFDYRSRWDPSARSQIKWEAIGLVLVVTASSILLVLSWTGHTAWFIKNPAQKREFIHVACAGFSGVIGGMCFSLKWFYHVVAKGAWHEDRRYWRIFAPMISGIVSAFMFVLVKSNLFGMFNAAVMDRTINILSLGFLVGYFSDSAVAKLAEVAASVFGTVTNDSGRKPQPKS